MKVLIIEDDPKIAATIHKASSRRASTSMSPPMGAKV
jgi:DNA-binding response OmpR family regulator